MFHNDRRVNSSERHNNPRSLSQIFKMQEAKTDRTERGNRQIHRFFCYKEMDTCVCMAEVLPCSPVTTC